MKALSAIKRILYSASFAFTMTMLVFMGMLAIAMDDTAKAQTLLIPLERYPLLLLFSLIVGALNNLLTAQAVPLGARLPIHIVGVLGAFYFIILRGLGLGQHGSGRLSLMLVASIIYAITLTAAFFIRRLFIKKADKASK